MGSQDWATPSPIEGRKPESVSRWVEVLELESCQRADPPGADALLLSMCGRPARSPRTHSLSGRPGKAGPSLIGPRGPATTENSVPSPGSRSTGTTGEHHTRKGSSQDWVPSRFLCSTPARTPKPYSPGLRRCRRPQAGPTMPRRRQVSGMLPASSQCSIEPR